MATPQSKKLVQEESQRKEQPKQTQAAPADSGPVQIREVEVCNDFVAILQAQQETGSIELPDSVEKYINEGIVIGIGPLIGEANRELIKIGDSVMFGPRQKVAEINSDSPPYKGKKVIIVSEKSVVCRLATKIDWEEYKG